MPVATSPHDKHFVLVGPRLPAKDFHHCRLQYSTVPSNRNLGCFVDFLRKDSGIGTVQYCPRFTARCAVSIRPLISSAENKLIKENIVDSLAH